MPGSPGSGGTWIVPAAPVGLTRPSWVTTGEEPSNSSSPRICTGPPVRSANSAYGAGITPVRFQLTCEPPGLTLTAGVIVNTGSWARPDVDSWENITAAQSKGRVVFMRILG